MLVGDGVSEAELSALLEACRPDDPLTRIAAAKYHDTHTIKTDVTVGRFIRSNQATRSYSNCHTTRPPSRSRCMSGPCRWGEFWVGLG
jgi:hypothetical protein